MSPFAELLATPGVREECELRGRVGFMAFHGGGLEAMTDVIAAEAAEHSGASYYGVLHPDDQRHIPSHHISPAVSPTLAAFVEHVETVITIHGYGRQNMWTSILLGGRNRPLAEHLAGQMRGALPDYEVITDMAAIPARLRGMHAANPVNLPRRQGVQIELPPRVRGRSPHWAGWRGPGHVPPMKALISALAAAATSWPG